MYGETFLKRAPIRSMPAWERSVPLTPPFLRDACDIVVAQAAERCGAAIVSAVGVRLSTEWFAVV